MTSLLQTLGKPIKYVNDQIDQVLDPIFEPHAETIRDRPTLFKSISVILILGGFALNCEIAGRLWATMVKNMPQFYTKAIEKIASITHQAAEPVFEFAEKFFKVKTTSYTVKGYNYLGGLIPVAAGVAIVVGGMSICGILYGAPFVAPLLPGFALSILGAKLLSKTKPPIVPAQE